MPATSRSQARLMYAVANNPKLAKETGISQKVAKEFVKETGSMKGLPEKKKKAKA